MVYLLDGRPKMCFAPFDWCQGAQERSYLLCPSHSGAASTFYFFFNPRKFSEESQWLTYDQPY